MSDYLKYLLLEPDSEDPESIRSHNWRRSYIRGMNMSDPTIPLDEMIQFISSQSNADYHIVFGQDLCIITVEIQFLSFYSQVQLDKWCNHFHSLRYRTQSVIKQENQTVFILSRFDLNEVEQFLETFMESQGYDLEDVDYSPELGTGSMMILIDNPSDLWTEGQIQEMTQALKPFVEVIYIISEEDDEMMEDEDDDEFYGSVYISLGRMNSAYNHNAYTYYKMSS